MSLVLRRTAWLDGDNRPNDYTVFHDGRKVGRIYQMNSTARELGWDTDRLGAVARSERRGGGYLGGRQGRVPPDVGRLRRI
jgi:hypothetical protein